MTQLASFESEDLRAKQLPTMDDVLAALLFDTALAEDLFSRLVKASMRELVKSPHNLHERPENVIPCLVLHVTLATYRQTPSALLSPAVQGLLKSLADSIDSTSVAFGNRPLLLGAFIGSVRNMGGSLYRFSIRVSCAVGSNSPEDALALAGE